MFCPTVFDRFLDGCYDPLITGYTYFKLILQPLAEGREVKFLISGQPAPFVQLLVVEAFYLDHNVMQWANQQQGYSIIVIYDLYKYAYRMDQLNLYLLIFIIVNCIILYSTQSVNMKNQTYRSIHKDFSTKSLNKYKFQFDKNNNHFPPPIKKKEDGNLYTITTNTVNFSSNKEPSRKEQDQNKRIKTLENELKKKLTDDGILRNLFKTKTHAQLSHIDIFLEIRRLQQALRNALEREKQQRNKLSLLEEAHKKQEEQHLRFIEILDDSVEQKQRQWRAQKLHLQQSNNRLKEDCQNHKFLLQQIRKKYAALTQKLKQANDELEIQRQAKILGELKQKQQHQNQIQNLLLDIQSLKKQNYSLKQQLQTYSHQINCYVGQIEEAKDEKQKLQLRIREFQEVSNDFNYSKRQEKEKYQQYYQKLKVDYQKEIESIVQEHQMKIKDENNRFNMVIQDKKKLQAEITTLKAKLQQYETLVQRLNENNIIISQREQNYKSQFDTLQPKLAKLSRELLQTRYEKDELILQIQKNQLSLQEKSKSISKLEGRISEMNSINASLQVECQQYKRQAQANQSYLKINNKVYNDNYKTLGRLIEINNKIKVNLNVSKEQQKSINEQSLGEVVSYLTELLERFIASYNSQKKKQQQLTRQRNIENRQIVNVIQQCKQFISNEYAENLLTKYLFYVKDRKNITLEQANEKLQIYHQLIENLMNLNSIKNYHSDNQHANLKDSLQSTYLQRDASISNKFTHRLIEKSQSNKLIRRKERLSTEPICDLPLKIQLFEEDENKQNLSVNVNKNVFEQQKQAKAYISNVRQKISNKLGQKRAVSRTSVNGRSQIEKKYFRS